MDFKIINIKEYFRQYFFIDEVKWGEWSEWTRSVSKNICEKGVQSRRRNCLLNGEKTNSFRCTPGPSLVIATFKNPECNSCLFYSLIK
jgi:hypothetical protein